MKENKGSYEILLLFDGIGLLITTVALMLVYSKLTGSLDTNLMIASFFFFGVKLLFVGIADVIGFGRKIGFGILFIVIANGILLAINLFMAFGISYTLMLISAGADLLAILLIRIIRNSRTREQIRDEKDASGNSADFSDIAFEEDDFNAFRSDDSLKDIREVINDPNVSIEGFNQPESLPDNSIKEDGLSEFNDNQPVVGVDMELLDALDSLKEDQYGDLQQSEELLFEDEEITETDAAQSEECDERKTLLPSDVPNLAALDAFFDEPAEAKTAQSEALPIQSESEVMDSMSSVNQELTQQIQELHNRLDDLEAREAELKKKEKAMEQVWQKKIELRPKEVILDDEDSEIIINEDDLELLKAYIRRGKKI